MKLAKKKKSAEQKNQSEEKKSEEKKSAKRNHKNEVSAWEKEQKDSSKGTSWY